MCVVGRGRPDGGGSETKEGPPTGVPENAHHSSPWSAPAAVGAGGLGWSADPCNGRLPKPAAFPHIFGWPADEPRPPACSLHPPTDAKPTEARKWPVLQQAAPAASLSALGQFLHQCHGFVCAVSFCFPLGRTLAQCGLRNSGMFGSGLSTPKHVTSVVFVITAVQATETCRPKMCSHCLFSMRSNWTIKDTNHVHLDKK